MVTFLIVGCGGGAGAGIDGGMSDSHDGSTGGDDGGEPAADAAVGGEDGGGRAEDGGSTDGGSGRGEPDDVAVNTSGTRIKMRVGTTPDGAKAFLGWYDTMRGDDCTFLVASDGQRRCLPGTSVFVGSFFADNGCTQPLAYVSLSGCSSAPAAKYASRFDTSCTTGGSVIRLYPVTGMHTGTAYLGSPGNCIVTNPGSFTLYAIGAEIPATAFQPVTESLE